MPDVSVRAATLADAEPIALLAGELGYPTGEADIRARLESLLDSDADAVLVAVDDADVIGWIHVAEIDLVESAPHAEIRGMVVTESRRGEGIGTRLVEAAETWAWERQLRRIRVRSNVTRERTHAFYEGRGYAVKKSQKVFDKILVALFCVLLSITANAQTLRAHLHGTIRAHTAPLRDVRFSPDSRLLATAGVDNVVRFWRIADGALVRTLTHPSGVTAIDFNRDGSLLATGSYDHAVRIWRVRDGTLLRTISGHEGTVWAVAFTPDGTRVVSGGEDKTVRVWRVADGASLRILRGHTLNVWAVSCSGDGRFITSSSFDHSIRIWRADNGALVRTLNAHKEAVVDLTFSPDSSLIASSGDDSTVRIWRVRDGVLLRTMSTDSDHTYAVAFSPNGQFLASGNRESGALGTLWKQAFGTRKNARHGATVRIWRVRDGVLLQSLSEHSGDVMSVAFSPDGRWLASGSEDHTVKLWRLESRSLMPEPITAGLLGLLGGSALLLGAFIGVYAKVSQRWIAMVMAFGSGVLISALSFELMEKAATKEHGFTATAIGFIAGATVYSIANYVLSHRGAKHRKRSQHHQAKEREEHPNNSGTAIAVGALLDGIPESIAIGVSLVDPKHWFVTVAAVFLSNVPEALSSSAGMKTAGRPRGYIFGVWTTIAVASGVAAMIGNFVFSGDSQPPWVIPSILAVAAGAILAMLADTMIPEAFEAAHDWAGLVTVAGFVAAFVMSRL